MNDLAALSGTTTMMALTLSRMILLGALIWSVFVREMSVRGTRRRYRASTVLRATVIPVTILTTVKVAVIAATGDWVEASLTAVMLAVMPFYFKLANDEDDDWWTGRWTKIRKAVKAAFSAPATNPATAGA